MVKFLSREQCKKLGKSVSVRLILLTIIATSIAYLALAHVKHPPSSKLVLSAHLEHHHAHLERLDATFKEINIINNNIIELKNMMELHKIEEHGK